LGSTLRQLILILLLTPFLTTICEGQVPYQLFSGSGTALNFDDTTTTKYFYIDTTLTENIWQIGTPQKTMLDSAYSPPSALITDTLNSYPPDNFSTTNMTFSVAEGLMWFWFVHKYDTDTLEDGGKIELSIDGGTNWYNLRDSAYWHSIGCTVDGVNLYSYQDTVASLVGQGFSGNSGGWLDAEIEFYYQNITVPMDTFQLRFVFASDSVETNKEGWLIDDIHIGANHIGVEEHQDNGFSFHPNPTTGLLSFEVSVNHISEIHIYDSNGRKIESRKVVNGQLDISHLINGIYFVTITSDQFNKTGKVVLKK